MENITQAMARDILAHSMVDIEAAGGRTVLTVHDEIVLEAPEASGWDEHKLVEFMTRERPWTEGLPLHAMGFTTPRYRKD